MNHLKLYRLNIQIYCMIHSPKGRFLLFYSRKLEGAHLNYNVTEQDSLRILETLNKFRAIIHGHIFKEFKCHENLEYENSTALS